MATNRESMLSFGDSGREAKPLDILDSVTGAPFRRGVSEMQEGNFLGAPGAMYEQFGKDPTTSPSMEDIAVRAGVPEGYASSAAGLLGSFAEPGLPFGAMMGGIKNVGKGADNVIDATEMFLKNRKKTNRMRTLLGEGSFDVKDGTVSKIGEEVADISQKATKVFDKTIPKEYDDLLNTLDGRFEGKLNSTIKEAQTSLRSSPYSSRRFDDHRFNRGPVDSRSPIPVPNYKAKPINGTIGDAGIQQPFDGNFREPFPWMDNKYKSGKKMLLESDKPLTINTSSDLLGRQDYIDAIPQGSTVNMHLLTNNENFNRQLFSGNPSNSRLKKAVARLEENGIRVQTFTPDVEDIKKALSPEKMKQIAKDFPNWEQMVFEAKGWTD